MSAKHTPGPWTVVDESGRGLEVHMPEPCQDTPVCSMRWTDGLNPDVTATKLADAHLIAASPDLLEACCLMFPLMRGVVPPPGEDQFIVDQAYEAARAAIAKAERGGS